MDKKFVLSAALPLAAACLWGLPQPSAEAAAHPVMVTGVAQQNAGKTAAGEHAALQAVPAAAQAGASAAKAANAEASQQAAEHTAVNTAESQAIRADKTDEAVQKNNFEVQLEYLDARAFKKRDVNLYNIHLYHEYRKLGALSLHYGLTLERALGSTTEDDIWRDAEAVGFGPSYMLRWTRHVSGKLDASLDATGSVLAYNHAHPGNGRAFGFLWRIGPRLTYHYTDRNAISLGYIFHHSSNGFKSHNPGYNGVGFSLGFVHNF